MAGNNGFALTRVGRSVSAFIIYTRSLDARSCNAAVFWLHPGAACSLRAGNTYKQKAGLMPKPEHRLEIPVDEELKEVESVHRELPKVRSVSTFHPRCWKGRRGAPVLPFCAVDWLLC